MQDEDESMISTGKIHFADQSGLLGLFRLPHGFGVCVWWSVFEFASIYLTLVRSHRRKAQECQKIMCFNLC